MSSYWELIKNFERIRACMRDFYVYGIKTREEYHRKSARSYDDDRRRLESWLGEHMGFERNASGKNVFISIDSQAYGHNPLYKAWKSKSFTDGDITLHFILLDILYSPNVALPLSEILRRIDEEYLSAFETPMLFDESTVRKKLKEYIKEGLLLSQKKGKTVLYRRAAQSDLSCMENALDFFSEVAPCGVIGSFLLDKTEPHESAFSFKHHYIAGAMDSEILALIFLAMREKRAVVFHNCGKKRAGALFSVVPLRVCISVQSGRQHLLAYDMEAQVFHTFRLDYLSELSVGDEVAEFDQLRATLDTMQLHIWGVNTKQRGRNQRQTEHVDFTVRVGKDEGFIISRLEREKHIGTLEKIDDYTYRFVAEVYDTTELIPWIRTFLCRITELNFSNKAIERQFREDVAELYRIYGLTERSDTI